MGSSEDVTYLLRDRNERLVEAWNEAFADDVDTVKVSHGDIFKGAPAADALVSPANSFGCMDGGIDYVYSEHYGWQMQERLQEVIRSQYNGELLVGQAVIITCTPDKPLAKAGCNEDKPIHYLVSAPTMRVPMTVDKTVNAFLAFRAVILAVRAHNASDCLPKIRSVLCPGLGTAVGRMTPDKCARQMKEAFDKFAVPASEPVKQPTQKFALAVEWKKHDEMVEDRVMLPPFSSASPKQAKKKDKATASSSADSQKSSSRFSCLWICLWVVAALLFLAGAIWVELHLGKRFEQHAEDLDSIFNGEQDSETL